MTNKKKFEEELSKRRIKFAHDTRGNLQIGGQSFQIHGRNQPFVVIPNIDTRGSIIVEAGNVQELVDKTLRELFVYAFRQYYAAKQHAIAVANACGMPDDLIQAELEKQ